MLVLQLIGLFIIEHLVFIFYKNLGILILVASVKTSHLIVYDPLLGSLESLSGGDGVKLLL